MKQAVIFGCDRYRFCFFNDLRIPVGNGRFIAVFAAFAASFFFAGRK
ncbi:MAG: hypothetical protein M3342_18715 [Bacteroidota bacterium]|nr:hypothetical protein [Bacteroidota bacterium]